MQQMDQLGTFNRQCPKKSKQVYLIFHLHAFFKIIWFTPHDLCHRVALLCLEPTINIWWVNVFVNVAEREIIVNEPIVLYLRCISRSVTYLVVFICVLIV